MTRKTLLKGLRLMESKPALFDAVLALLGRVQDGTMKEGEAVKALNALEKA